MIRFRDTSEGSEFVIDIGGETHNVPWRLVPVQKGSKKQLNGCQVLVAYL